MIKAWRPWNDRMKIPMLAGCLIVAAPLALAATKAGPPNPQCEVAFPATEVGKATGAHPLHVRGVDSDKGSFCMYDRKDGKNVLMLLLIGNATASSFNDLRSQEIYRKNQQAVDGVGDEAFTVGEGGGALFVRKGEWIYGLTPGIKQPGKAWLTRDQLLGLARESLSNL